MLSLQLLWNSCLQASNGGWRSPPRQGYSFQGWCEFHFIWSDFSIFHDPIHSVFGGVFHTVYISRCGRSWPRCTLALPIAASHLASRPSLVAASPPASPSSMTPWTSPRSSSQNTGKYMTRSWRLNYICVPSYICSILFLFPQNDEICPAVLSIGVCASQET